MAKILVIGATGHVGRKTLDEALKDGHDVTAFGRSIDTIELEDERLTIVKGDVTEPSDVGAAVPGHDCVVLTFGAPLNRDTVLHAPDLCEKGTRIVVDQMRSAGVPRLIAMTAIGAGDSKGHGRFIFRNVIEPALLGRIMEDRTNQEEVVRSSQLPEWIIVRPTELTDGESAPVRVIRDLESEPEPGTISRRDVARMLVEYVENKRDDGRAVLITN